MTTLWGERVMKTKKKKKLIFSFCLIFISILGSNLFLCLPSDAGVLGIITRYGNIILAIATAYSVTSDIDLRLTKYFMGNRALQKNRKQLIMIGAILLLAAWSSPIVWLFYGRLNIWHFLFNLVGAIAGFGSILLFTALPKIKPEHNGEVMAIEYAILSAVLVLQLWYQYYLESEFIHQGFWGPYLNAFWLVIVTTIIFIAITYGFSTFRSNRIMSVIIKGKRIDPFVPLLIILGAFVVLYLTASFFKPLPLQGVYVAALMSVFFVAYLVVDRYIVRPGKEILAIIVNLLISIAIVAFFYLQKNMKFYVESNDVWMRYQAGVAFLITFLLFSLPYDIQKFYEAETKKVKVSASDIEFIKINV